MHEQQQKIGILFDLDYSLYISSLSYKESTRKILRNNCWLELTYLIAIEIHCFSEEKALQHVQRHIDLYNQVQQGELPLQDSIPLLFAIWTNDGKVQITQDAIYSIAQRFSYRENSKELFVHLSQIGVLGLATGAFDIAAHVASQQHQILTYYANSTLLFENGVWTGFEHNPNLPQQKLEHAQLFIEKYGLKELIVVGDGESDAALFRASADDLGLQRLIKVAIGHYLDSYNPDIVIEDDAESWAGMHSKILAFLGNDRTIQS